MNEKIKESVLEWAMRWHPDLREDIKSTAWHFYDLALQDVKKEIEDTALNIACPGYSSISACRDFIKFIDSLTK